MSVRRDIRSGDQIEPQQHGQQVRGDTVHANVPYGWVSGRETKKAITRRDDGQIQASRMPANPEDQVRAAVEPPTTNTETYDQFSDNKFLDVVSNPLSTFSID